MDRYTEAYIVVEGALDSEEEFPTSDEAETWLRNEIAAIHRLNPEYTAEGYLIDHEHSPTDEECACVQYLTDHRPQVTA